MRQRHMIELTPEANAALTAIARRTGKTKKDLASTALVKLSAWDDLTQSLTWGTAPASMLGNEAFWREAEAAMVAGIRRCREKYISGA